MFATATAAPQEQRSRPAPARRPEPPLRVSDPGDASEREAVRIASIVARGEPGPARAGERFTADIARSKCAECEAAGGSCAGCEEEEEPGVMRSAESPGAGVAGARAAVASARASEGAALPGRLRDFFADRMGASFDAVRVHDGPAAARAARSVSARAFTVGRDVVFGAGQFRPDTVSGRELIAHELVHTLQRDDAMVRRQVETQPAPAQPAPAPAPRRPAAGTAAATPAPEVRPSQNGEPCACIVFMHNNERNARLTAELLHTHCRFNLAIVEPDNRGRLLAAGVRVERGRTTRDPNELFPPDITRECINDPVGCSRFLSENEGARDAATIRRFVLIRFFMRIYEYSRGFTLPVVALHNNAPDETVGYRAATQRARRRGDPVPDLRMDIDKSDESPTAPTVARLRELLRGSPWGAGIERSVTGVGGSTNIFRWCAASDIGRCHIGDPDRPDNVIWTTNPDDFRRLSATPVNVVLQTAAGPESQTDLSTLFLNLHGLIDPAVLTAIAHDRDVEVAELRLAWEALSNAPSVGAGWDLVRELLQLLYQLVRHAEATRAHALRPSQIRYVNIETPGFGIGAVTDAQRVESFRVILGALRALGLDCCGTAGDPGGAIEQGLHVAPAPRRAPARRP